MFIFGCHFEIFLLSEISQTEYKITVIFQYREKTLQLPAAKSTQRYLFSLFDYCLCKTIYISFYNHLLVYLSPMSVFKGLPMAELLLSMNDNLCLKLLRQVSLNDPLTSILLTQKCSIYFDQRKFTRDRKTSRIFTQVKTSASP